ncbi:unnamed protein product [Prorocentrum cordatum]|uniref:PPM-type phosphatase domain-containing protein n=1 Tax=Prorocentrum cordatum TaxID=2364126 RepID=A0ABN9Y3K5_9DINO|nr:unnamed protein product [Polarella glacialis]
MDGHGGQGVVRHAGQHLQEELLRLCGAEAAGAWPECARAAFVGFQDEVRRKRLRGGATAVAIFLRADGSQAAFAWVGDSSAVVIRGGDVLFRTTKHSLDNADEVARIKAGDYRYFMDDGYLCTPRGRCVAPTRALGDIEMESAGLISTPEASEWIDLQPGDIIIAASDGIWDVLPEEPVVRHLAKMPLEADLVQAASGLAETAVREWTRQYGRASEADDISVLLYRHPPQAE